MLSIEPTGTVPTATMHELGPTEPLSAAAFAALLRGPGAHGALRIPGQRIEARHLLDFPLPNDNACCRRR